MKTIFIDDGVNCQLISSLETDKIKIKEYYEVIDNKIVLYKSNDSELEISHGTICAKIFCDNVLSCCDLYFIKILDQNSKKTNIDQLVIALNWCYEHEIKLINLSLGTTNIYDTIRLYDIIKKLFDKGTIIVASSANKNLITFPAAFEEVISVKTADFNDTYGFIYNPNSLDFIDVLCSIKPYKIIFNHMIADVYNVNSFVTPYVTAQICNYINNGLFSLDLIKQKLFDKSLRVEYNYLYEFKKGYAYNEKEIPMIGFIVSEEDISTNKESVYLFIKKIILSFQKRDYLGICISSIFETCFINRFIKVKHNDYFCLSDIVQLYSSYVDPSLIIFLIFAEQYEIISKELMFDLSIMNKSTLNNMIFEDCIIIDHYNEEDGLNVCSQIIDVLEH